MKTYIINILVVLGVIALQSCDKNFDTLNTNPDAVAVVSPQYVFTKAQYDGAGGSRNGNPSILNFLLGTMQYTTSYNDVSGFGSKYNVSQVGQTYTAFSNGFPDEINELGIVIKAVTGNAALVNELAEAKIWRVYCFSHLTDLYGDIPYSQAALGYDQSVYKPTYDAQKDIYANMLSQLDSATQILDASKANFGSADLLYGGTTDKWKKFAYSLMLRLGMRMTKVDPVSAKTWVTKAIAGGIIMLDADIAKIAYLATGQDINKNPITLFLWNNDYIAQNGATNTEGGKYQDVFINYLKATQDPRLNVISVVYNNGVPDTSTAIQKGMPATIPNIKPANFVTYSEPNPKTVLVMSSPRLLISTAESFFLLSEAALRGWYSAASADSMYRSGVRAAMRQWAIISGAVVTDPQVNAYLANNPYNTAGSFDQQMQQIYNQFWVSIFPNGEEAFASYRRTGYPALVPNNYPNNATGGKIFRRMLYPLSEQNLNAASYAAAVSRQGADDLLTHIWWDK